MARAKEKKFKWEPSQMIKHPDGIKSSDYTNAKPFIPSYEREEQPQMRYLMSMEYAKMWHREREELERSVVQETKNQPKKIVIRGLNKKKQDLKKVKENIKKQPQTKSDLKKK